MKKGKGKRSLEIGVVCRTIQEHYDMLGIVCYLQGYYRKFKLYKKKTWFKDNDDLHSWAKKTIKEYKKLQTRPFSDEKDRKKRGKGVR